MEARPKMKRGGMEFNGKLSVRIDYKERHNVTVKEFRQLRAYLNKFMDELWKEIVEDAIIDHERKLASRLLKETIPAEMRRRVEREYAAKGPSHRREARTRKEP